MKKSELLDEIKSIVADSCCGCEDSSSHGGMATPGKETELQPVKGVLKMKDPLSHNYGNEILCETDKRGFATPDNKDLTELVLDASEGFIPLWAFGVVLRWKFNESSMQAFRYPEQAKTYIRNLFSSAINAWGDSAPVRFTEVTDSWDFEIYMRPNDNCRGGGCVLASAFFPDAGRHRLYLYPKMFTQSTKEQKDTFIHELGHVFGLRHFFAKIREGQWPSEIYGDHDPFTIMNYGSKSELTDVDKSDLKKLYSGVWRGQMTHINGTPIRLFRPYHEAGGLVWPGNLAAAVS